MVLQYLTGYDDNYKCVQGVLGWCFNIANGNMTIIDAFRGYLHGASIAHRVR